MVLGRGPNAVVMLRETGVEDAHARITHESAGWILQDLSAHNELLQVAPGKTAGQRSGTGRDRTISRARYRDRRDRVRALEVLHRWNRTFSAPRHLGDLTALVQEEILRNQKKL